MINFRLVRHLWLFLAVAEERHFGRAAKRLGMSQPPLTEQIHVLENALKVKLFERSRKGAQLTPVGQAILPAVRQLADQLERVELAVREAKAGQSGILTVGAITSVLLDVLPPHIEAWKRDFPGITVSVREIDSGEAVLALESGELDLAFVRLEGLTSKKIQVLPLHQEQLAVALPRGHALAALPAVPLSSLAEENFILCSRALNPVYFDTLLACCRDSGFSPRVLHEVRMISSQVAFVGCGQGVALVPLAQQSLAPANVVVRPLAGDLRVVTAALAWNAARANPLVEAIAGRLRAAGGATN
ncbi:MAG: LysR family transcriptional regulator [Paludibacterium sp.]|uniref:LysR substrate-binding domain-containing protein n=1 Tax=Paludibacterium sp. TaxID=1917523 RepID=UPI0025E8168F|nr:LysR substrate-binding domain-containing protein [Paludibacterium sp.]MBV8048313.1 LysR family transcriptional regulator [Paludibacterium sp.]MBV8648930.1 LysR family transcriptional regulator [Paludibacterium sp.]